MNPQFSLPNEITVRDWIARAAKQTVSRTRGVRNMSPSDREECEAAARCAAIKSLTPVGTARAARWCADEASHPTLACVRSAMARAAVSAAQDNGFTGDTARRRRVRVDSLNATPWIETAAGLADYAARTAPDRQTMARKVRYVRRRLRESRARVLAGGYVPSLPCVRRSYQKLLRALPALCLGEGLIDIANSCGYPIDYDGRCRTLERGIRRSSLTRTRND